LLGLGNENVTDKSEVKPSAQSSESAPSASSAAPMLSSQMPNQNQQILLQVRFVKSLSAGDNMFHTQDQHSIVEIVLLLRKTGFSESVASASLSAGAGIKE
jgi:hypothetical protein